MQRIDPSQPDPDASDPGAVRVTGAEPTHLPLDSTFTLRVFGSGFGTDSKVVLKVNGAPTPKVHTNATLFVSPRELDASITTAADAPGGPYDLEVEGRNGKQGIGTELVDLKAHLFGISPASAQPGQSVTISGINFGSDRDQVTVTFDGVDAVVQSVSNASITTNVPFGLALGTANVQVTIADAPVPATIIFEVIPFPSLSGVWTMTGEVEVLADGFYTLSGSVTFLESGDNLSGDANLSLTGGVAFRSFFMGAPAVGHMDAANGSVTFTVDPSKPCQFAGLVVPGNPLRMEGIVSSCPLGGGVLAVNGPWEATLQ
jgi:hypothetical protein